MQIDFIQLFQLLVLPFAGWVIWEIRDMKKRHDSSIRRLYDKIDELTKQHNTLKACVTGCKNFEMSDAAKNLLSK